jgi:hypothetical protein
MKLIRSVLLVGVGILGFSQSQPDGNDRRWGCYDAQPGHPSDSERRHFIEESVEITQDIEQRGGPPAAGLLAMAALESGSGFTRTALFANNLFGWKYTTAAAAAGRVAWTLACQPASDPGNQYVVFRDHRDSFSFVGNRLAQNDRYKPVTRQYHADRAAGIVVEEAVRKWVKGIQAAGYNPDPAYPDRVISIANNFERPGKAISARDALYAYSARITASPRSSPTRTSPARMAAEQVLSAGLPTARYMSQNCGPNSITTWPGYEGRSVQRCAYSVTSNQKTLSAIVYLLNPSMSNLVDRIGYACDAIAAGNKLRCGRELARMILRENGGQFPIAGFVIERKQDAGGAGPDPVYLEFRDGTTVVTADKLNFTDQQLTVDAMEHAATATVIATRVYARVANGTRDDYHRAGGSESVGTDPTTDRQNKWPTVIRRNELQAQDSGIDVLLRGVAIRMRPSLTAD